MFREHFFRKFFSTDGWTDGPAGKKKIWGRSLGSFLAENHPNRSYSRALLAMSKFRKLCENIVIITDSGLSRKLKNTPRMHFDLILFQSELYMLDSLNKLFK